MFAARVVAESLIVKVPVLLVFNIVTPLSISAMSKIAPWTELVDISRTVTSESNVVPVRSLVPSVITAVTLVAFVTVMFPKLPTASETAPATVPFALLAVTAEINVP